MSRVPSLSSPFLLGFDEIERALDRVVKGADGYPPYNIERCDRANGQPERLRITLDWTTGYEVPVHCCSHEDVPGGPLMEGVRTVKCPPVPKRCGHHELTPRFDRLDPMGAIRQCRPQ